MPAMFTCDRHSWSG